MTKIVPNMKKIQFRKRSIISWRPLFIFHCANVLTCNPSMWYFHLQATEEYLEKRTDRLRASLSQNHFRCILFPYYLCGDVLHHHLKRTNRSILQTVSRILFTCSNSALTCSFNSCSFSFESLTSVVFCASCAWKNSHKEIIRKLRIPHGYLFNKLLSPF